MIDYLNIGFHGKFSVNQDVEKFLCRVQLEAFFHDKEDDSKVLNKDTFFGVVFSHVSRKEISSKVELWQHVNKKDNSKFH